ncbi:MAG: trans-2-enoyl-CoA reductase family protein [Herbinix sp.]|nr:trans-2-enoyl-CoA reductase family protein [Herbinix sp.]
MIIEPKVKGFICMTSHPEGCKENVARQISYIKKLGKTAGPQKVLVIGASTGYGLASRIAVTYACDASTIGIMYEKPATDRRTATPGWYNTTAFEDFAAKDGYYAKSINGDAFSKEIKDQAIELIKNELGKVDMVIYSLAAPRRTMQDGTIYNSTLKTVEGDFTNKSLNLNNNTVIEATIGPATEEEILSTVKVMGGEDWKDWITALVEADVLSDNAITLAYSYIGPKLTYPVYYNGTIGLAKKHLYNTSVEITKNFASKGIKAYISVNKALVTQASSAIPIVPLYFAILYKVMKEKGNHEGCIEQMGRLFHEKLNPIHIDKDEENRIRLDDYEMQEDIQTKVMEIWNQINTENVSELADLTGYWDDFFHMFGFRFDNIDYSKDVEI